MLGIFCFIKALGLLKENSLCHSSYPKVLAQNIRKKMRWGINMVHQQQIIPIIPT